MKRFNLRRGSYDSIVGKVIGKHNYYYDELNDELMAFVRECERYYELKDKALKLWAGKTHTNSGSALSYTLSAVLPGSPDWDHKPHISPVWGHHNRLGNVPYYFFTISGRICTLVILVNWPASVLASLRLEAMP
jgi:hypothetical protein